MNILEVGKVYILQLNNEESDPMLISSIYTIGASLKKEYRRYFIKEKDLNTHYLYVTFLDIYGTEKNIEREYLSECTYIEQSKEKYLRYFNKHMEYQENKLKEKRKKVKDILK